MKECVIFCAAGFDGLAIPLTEEDYLIAADGGLKHMESLGVTPNAIIGDFDSLNYIPTGAEVFPVEKDDTDMMLAIKLGLSRGYREFAIYGGLGGRLDHTIANIQSLTYLAGEGAAGILYGDSYALTVIKDSSFTVPKDATGMVSVFSLSDSSENVSIKGLKYEVDGVTLTNAFPLGVSNETTAKKGIISVGSGTLLILWHP